MDTKKTGKTTILLLWVLLMSAQASRLHKPPAQSKADPDVECDEMCAQRCDDLFLNEQKCAKKCIGCCNICSCVPLIDDSGNYYKSCPCYYRIGKNFTVCP
eukprot:TRINITY_DN4229_c0_g2_i1.p2 TRINITY_DN4229_c0_g2~~TRINITY_DN4229_c0_g2_i1.p2  ORF type:complete len:101 (+),score=17.46 TRINITY_DN4229_c0_g2_i1:178-480(+)